MSDTNNFRNNTLPNKFPCCFYEIILHKFSLYHNIILIDAVKIHFTFLLKRFTLVEVVIGEKYERKYLF